ncbi:carbohydrate ABC transporter permease [Candidatus Acetothermia bacterium]|nr:carbohydrate ABC transporter permease [Candidatus Acetothermia bacterium]
MRIPRWLRRSVEGLSLGLILTVFVVFTAFPFYWMALASFKQDADLYRGATDMTQNPYWFNIAPSLEHFAVLFTPEAPFLKYVWNTFKVGAFVSLITLLIAVPAGYSLARLAGRWGEHLGIGIFITYLVPPTLLFIPLTRVINMLGLQDSHWALILIYPTFTIPFCTWLMMGFFKSIPKDIEEQAMIDGHSRLGAILRTVLPLSLPGLLTVVIFSFTLSMQEFVYALTFINSRDNFMISVGVPTNLITDVYNIGAIAAATLICSIPVAILYNLFLDRFIAGLTGGAVKG